MLSYGYVVQNFSINNKSDSVLSGIILPGVCTSLVNTKCICKKYAPIKQALTIFVFELLNYLYLFFLTYRFLKTFLIFIINLIRCNFYGFLKLKYPRSFKNYIKRRSVAFLLFKLFFEFCFKK